MPPLSGVVSPFGLSPGKIFCVSVGEEKKNSPRPSPQRLLLQGPGETHSGWGDELLFPSPRCPRCVCSSLFFSPLCSALLCFGLLWRSRVSASSVLPFLLFCSSKPDHRLRQRGRHTHIHNTDKPLSTDKQRKADTQILPYLLTGNERTLGHRSYRLLFPCSRAQARQDSWT